MDCFHVVAGHLNACFRSVIQVYHSCLIWHFHQSTISHYQQLSFIHHCMFSICAKLKQCTLIFFRFPFALHVCLLGYSHYTVICAFQTNTSVASSLGPHFFPQISLIFLDMLTVYRYLIFTALYIISVLGGIYYG